jgi:hypothetical protein
MMSKSLRCSALESPQNLLILSLLDSSRTGDAQGLSTSWMIPLSDISLVFREISAMSCGDCLETHFSIGGISLVSIR